MSIRSSSSSIHKINPATGEQLATYPIQDSANAQQCAQQARHCLNDWRNTSLQARAQLLAGIRSALYAQAQAMATLISQETGKPIADALEADVGTALSVLGYYAKTGPQVLRPRPIAPDFGSRVTGRSHQETYHPRGVIGIIAPWNYPLAIPLSGIAAALMAGNTVILKPSELTPGTGQALVGLCRTILTQKGHPANVVQLLQGDGNTGAALQDSDIDGLIFTGSAATGHRIQQKALEKKQWLSLELGGSDAMLILPGCDSEKTASYALWGRYTNAGQACAAVKRLFVPQAQLTEFSQILQQKVAQLRVGPPADPQAHLGPLISEAQRQVVAAQVADALQQGATLLQGGHALPGPGFFYEPTLLSQVPATCRVLQEEVFGPVLPVIGYENISSAIQQINASPYGLTASVFGPVHQAQSIALQLECGTVVINDVGPSNYAMPCAPWSGWKDSGSGSSHGVRALLELSRAQIVSINHRFSWPGLGKPLWHFGKSNQQTASRSAAILALSAEHPSLWHPSTWLAFWQHRSATKL